jgi:molybdopterin-guanine dinucleotide biosynthesis protein A
MTPFANPTEAVTGIVLAGGSNTRFGGEKAFASIGGVPMVLRVIDALSHLCSEILLVGGKTISLRGLKDVRFVPDAVKGFGAIAGILSGLQESRTEYGFCVGCDMPFLDGQLIRAQIGVALSADPAQCYDVVVPLHESGLEPLHALYSRRCIPALRKLVNSGERRIFKLYPLVRTHYFKIGADQQKTSFLNVNTNDDLQRAEEIFRERFSNLHRRICR